MLQSFKIFIMMSLSSKAEQNTNHSKYLMYLSLRLYTRYYSRKMHIVLIAMLAIICNQRD